ncbi:hypothetical protein [Sporomusa aerivorans]
MIGAKQAEAAGKAIDIMAALATSIKAITKKEKTEKEKKTG